MAKERRHDAAGQANGDESSQAVPMNKLSTTNELSTMNVTHIMDANHGCLVGVVHLRIGNEACVRQQLEQASYTAPPRNIRPRMCNRDRAAVQARRGLLVAAVIVAWDNVIPIHL